MVVIFYRVLMGIACKFAAKIHKKIDICKKKWNFFSFKVKV